MIEIRFHGRGGQGTVTAANVLSQAAFLEGKHSQSFPDFGTERRGAPVTAFCRIDEKKINIHSKIYQPDCVIVLEISLIKTIDVMNGLKKGGWLILNTKKKPEDYEHLLDSNRDIRIATIDATGIAIVKKLGSEKAPIVNTTILGALARATTLVRLESVLKAIEKELEQKISDNQAASKEAYEKVQIQLFEKEGENDV
ncbi:MAG: pyruvate ferredoxin oxidoreductase [Candidatus Tagabacteria bacterium CG_4_10_14_0_2_um_filter_40_13]|uniref:Pyruvate ferredoxin oxidoreductase n=1 Tax=Candidatus Tagabacteria bacterium CG_4_9_14_0_2_um_filter_41_11 TaxID=1975019 RepID=A0A2M8ERY4_9BACT|nr:pyruvate ferredoxin oxidoreductase [bacterium]PIZ56752.1 MAG: pyruvate ferredoxin oxidoreductase [Candidatus Tagabacteria bacterium CG_4_10_14_0_2_um_filter_40_13]PJC25441.1 MAG: pyruvate ferredoxin oxidoreductase [Candidatus Tagabacteria bacterium CG_4_9_14_0_2_um_filter_41_11]